MSDVFEYRPKYVDIRVKKPDPATLEREPTERPCDHIGCGRAGSHRAPKGRSHEGQFWHFCFEHAAAYNRRWNYFEGMSDAELAAYQAREEQMRAQRLYPELLAGEGMVTLLRDLRQQFDAVICDSAPLGAGIDPFALGVATGAMIIVLRTGETDRKLAQAKLEVLDRMPVRVLGTVLNDIGASPQFKYYYYLEGYGALENAVTEESALIGSGNGSGGRR